MHKLLSPLSASEDPPLWLSQWQARGGAAFMSYEQFTRPKRQALAEGKLKLVRPARRRRLDFIAQREAICRKCEHFDRAIQHPCHCRLLPVGASGCYHRRPTSCCPADPPRWGPARY